MTTDEVRKLARWIHYMGGRDMEGIARAALLMADVVDAAQSNACRHDSSSRGLDCSTCTTLTAFANAKLEG